MEDIHQFAYLWVYGPRILVTRILRCYKIVLYWLGKNDLYLFQMKVCTVSHVTYHFATRPFSFSWWYQMTLLKEVQIWISLTLLAGLRAMFCLYLISLKDKSLVANFTFDLNLLSKRQNKWDIYFLNFVAFSQYLNFSTNLLPHALHFSSKKNSD